ncbi:MAG: cache domain-containing protein [Lachnospiraceae bacterium]|nr:cache domain-containing protein [Lachnospiraceae bacterium]
MSKKRKGFSLRAQLILMSAIPAILIAVVLLTISSIKLSRGMMDEALNGLMASAELFRQEVMTTSRDLTTNELEDEYKAITGYDFTRFEGDTRASTSVIKSDGTRPVGTKAAPEVIDAVINKGQNYTDDKTEVAGTPYCVAYAPIRDDAGKVVGMAFAGKPTRDIEKHITESILIILGIGVVILVAAIVVVIMFANKLIAAVYETGSVIDHLSKGKFVKAERFTNRSDELGDMIRESNSLIDNLSEIVGGIKEASAAVTSQSQDLSSTADQISNTSDGVSEAVQEMAKGATDQADTVQKATENLTILSDAIQTVADNAEQLAGAAAEMNDASSQSASALKSLSETMETMGEAVQEISETMRQTNRAVQNVNEKVDGITSIASQTNLLALNASIEAARAGEAGRGFAVVAEEIGKLATESAQTAQEIREEMTTLLTHAQDAIGKTEEISKIKDSVNDVLTETTGTINNLIDNVGSTVDGVNTISGLTEECNASKEEIIDAMSSLSAISEENAASTEETSASMGELNATVNVLAGSANKLNDVAGKLDSELSFFN